MYRLLEVYADASWQRKFCWLFAFHVVLILIFLLFRLIYQSNWTAYHPHIYFEMLSAIGITLLLFLCLQSWLAWYAMKELRMVRAMLNADPGLYPAFEAIRSEEGVVREKENQGTETPALGGVEIPFLEKSFLEARRCYNVRIFLSIIKWITFFIFGISLLGILVLYVKDFIFPVSLPGSIEEILNFGLNLFQKNPWGGAVILFVMVFFGIVYRKCDAYGRELMDSLNRKDRFNVKVTALLAALAGHREAIIDDLIIRIQEIETNEDESADKLDRRHQSINKEGLEAAQRLYRWMGTPRHK